MDSLTADLHDHFERLLDLRELVVRKCEELAEDSSFNKAQANAVQAVLSDRLASQPPREFQNLVRPIFQGDEWILVAIGGALSAQGLRALS